MHGILCKLPGVCLPIQAKEALVSPSNVLHAGDYTLQHVHAADIDIQRLAHTRQNPVKQDRILSIYTLTYTPQWHPM